MLLLVHGREVYGVGRQVVGEHGRAGRWLGRVTARVAGLRSHGRVERVLLRAQLERALLERLDLLQDERLAGFEHLCSLGLLRPVWIRLLYAVRSWPCPWI